MFEELRCDAIGARRASVVELVDRSKYLVERWCIERDTLVVYGSRSCVLQVWAWLRDRMVECGSVVLSPSQ